MYYDLDKALTDVVIGMLIFAVAYLYDLHIGHRNTLELIENHLADAGKEAGA